MWGRNPIQVRAEMPYTPYMGRPKSLPRRMTLQNGVLVKSAELWLKLGEPVRALRELQRLPVRLWNHPWTRIVRRAIYRGF